MPRHVSRADLARLLGVSRPAVTKRCQGAWSAACAGDRVDLDHPLIQAAAKKRGVKLSSQTAPPDRLPTKGSKVAVKPVAEPTATPKVPASKPARTTKSRQPEAEPIPDQPDGAGSDEDLDELARIMRPVIVRFGTSRGCRDWLLSLKDLETIAGRRLANAEAKGLVIPREFVKLHVLGLVDGVFRRVLADTPKTLCRELYALARTGAPLEDAERVARTLIGKQLEGVRAKAIKQIQNGGTGSNGERSELASRAVRDADDRNSPADPV